MTDEPTPGADRPTGPFLAGFVDAFPDLQLSVEDAVGEGDLVAQRVHFRGTHTGEFQGLPPTQRTVSFSGSDRQALQFDLRALARTRPDC